MENEEIEKALAFTLIGMGYIIYKTKPLADQFADLPIHVMKAAIDATPEAANASVSLIDEMLYGFLNSFNIYDDPLKSNGDLMKENKYKKYY